MDYRKLIKFGKSSLVVSVPKTWVRSNKLKKGDIVHFEENNQNLVLHPNLEDESKEESFINIDVDQTNMRDLKRRIISAYVNDYKTIKLTGKAIKDIAKPIRDVIQNLIALEIMEQTSDHIIAKDFLDMKTISIEKTIRKIDVITKAMLDDTITCLEEDNSENILHREEDVNRLAFLVYRVIRHAFQNPSTKQTMKLNNIQLLEFWHVVMELEKIADSCKEIARFLSMMKLTPKLSNSVVSLKEEIRENYVSALKSVYKQNMDLAYGVSTQKQPLFERCGKLIEQNRQVKYAPELFYSIKRMISSIHRLSKVIVGL